MLTLTQCPKCQHLRNYLICTLTPYCNNRNPFDYSLDAKTFLERIPNPKFVVPEECPMYLEHLMEKQKV